MKRFLGCGVRAVLGAACLALSGVGAPGGEASAPGAAARADSPSGTPRGKDAEGQKAKTLTLEQCLQIAQRENLDIRSKERSVSKKDLDVASAGAVFIPTLTFSSSSDVEIDYYSKTLSVSQSLPWGTEVDASIYDPADPSASDPTRSVTISQPLLRGAGTAEGLANFRGARLSLEAERSRLEHLLADTTYRVKLKYYEIQRQLATIKVREDAVDRGEELFKEADLKFDLQMAMRLGRADAESQLLGRKANLVSARAGLEDSLDDLKEMLNLPLGEEIEVVPVALDLDKEIVVDPDEGTVSVVGTVPGGRPQKRTIFEPVKRDYAVTVKRALSKRPDLRAATLDLDAKKIEVRRKRVQRLWTLDVSATHIARGAGSAFDDTFTSEDSDWELGLTATWPLGRVTRRAEHGKAVLDYEIEEISLEKQIIAVRKEVRAIFRRLEETKANVLTYAKQTNAAKEALEGVRERKKGGLARVRDVTEREAGLLNAQTSFINSLLDYKKRLAELERAEGGPAFGETEEAPEVGE